MKLAPLLFALVWLLGLTAPIPCAAQETPRDLRWKQDLDYLIERLEITHPNLYANISRDSLRYYTDQLKDKIHTSTDVEMIFGVQELLARIENVHTLCRPVRFMADQDELKQQFRYYPVRYYPFDDGLYVTATTDKYRRILGKKVIKIGSLTSEEAMKALSRFIGADNAMTALANIPRWCLDDGQLLHYVGASDSPDRVTLTLGNDDGSTFEYEIVAGTDVGFGTPMVSMSARSKNPTPLYLTDPKEHFWFRYIPEREAVYVHISLLYNTKSESFGAFCRRMFDAFDQKHAKTLIIDVRMCPGGDNFDLPLLKGILARPHLDSADRLFLITGRMTASAAEHLTVQLRRYTNVTLFGESTSSKPNQYRNMQQFVLPNSKLEILCALDYFQDALPTDYAMATVPDIHVALRSSDFREKRDPVLERIFAYDSFAHMRPDFFTAMSGAYTKGGIPELKKVYGTLKDAYVKQGFNMENLLYRDLDGWMATNRKSDEDYVEFLKFIHEELPNSISICYDLAYWGNRSGDKEAAKNLYKRCLELNPEDGHAKWRLGVIELEEKRPELTSP